MCEYQGYEFGGGYIDSTCIDGYLWDLDSCDEPGGPLTRGGDIPCPQCNGKMVWDHFVEAVDRCYQYGLDPQYVANELAGQLVGYDPTVKDHIEKSLPIRYFDSRRSEESAADEPDILIKNIKWAHPGCKSPPSGRH